jgi:GH25 family lysozyme M1 (1,4-beta-N-acetylmuramidase)
VARTLGLRAVDLSHYQTTTTAGVIKDASSGVVLGKLTDYPVVIVKATHGSAQNSGWATHSANVRRAGSVLGAYHWLTDTDPMADQVAKFLAVAKSADFLVVDQEENGVSDAETQQFIDAIRSAGRPIGLYHSASGFGGVNSDFQWVADYRSASQSAGYPMTGDGTAEFSGWDIWQWSSKGGPSGAALDVDWINPASPLAKLLRLGYVSKPLADAQAAEAMKQIGELQNQVSALQSQVDQQSAIITSQNVELSATKADLLTTKQALADAEDARVAALAAAAAAAANERERIALAEAQRIRGL